MKAMVMAAGLGLRMRPLTGQIPKPLVPVADKPLIDYTLDWLEASGIEEAVVNSHYLADKLEAHLAGRKSPRVRISYEETLLETGGGIRQALPLLGSSVFLVVNSDTLCFDGPTPAVSRLRAHWDDAKMDSLLLLHPVKRAVGYAGAGDFFIDGWQLRRRLPHETAPYVFTGVQLLHPRLFKDAPEGAFSLNVLFDRLMAVGQPPRLRGLVHDGNWLHVGDPAGLAAAEAFLNGKNSS
jgi:MurNAc alpha-1-phosphate uridylyltransferase